MATYVIGDVHGCYDQLMSLLEKINFNHSSDTLMFTGDLINGGPKPAEVIRFIKDLGDKHICVLGNHDLLLLAISINKKIPLNDRVVGFDPVFAAFDAEDLIAWVRNRPLTHHISEHNMLLVHAGVLPTWDLTQIKEYATLVEKKIRSPEFSVLCDNFFTLTGDTWHDSLDEWSKICFIINCFTRMRFCYNTQQLDLSYKGTIAKAPENLIPWFKLPRNDNLSIIFGHWSALNGHTGVKNAIALDTGCVWGNKLTAYCLETKERTMIPH